MGMVIFVQFSGVFKEGGWTEGQKDSGDGFFGQVLEFLKGGGEWERLFLLGFGVLKRGNTDRRRTGTAFSVGFGGFKGEGEQSWWCKWGEEGKGTGMEPFWDFLGIQNPITCTLPGGRRWGQRVEVPHFVVGRTKIRLFWPRNAAQRGGGL